MTRVGQERVNRPAAGAGQQLGNARLSRQIDLDGVDRHRPFPSKGLGGVLNFRPVGGDQQIEALAGADAGQLVTDPGRGSRNNGKSIGHTCLRFQSAGCQ